MKSSSKFSYLQNQKLHCALNNPVCFYRMHMMKENLLSESPLILFGFPHRSSIVALLILAFSSCSFFSCSAAFFLNSNYENNLQIIKFLIKGTKLITLLTLNFFFLSGVIKPFFFLALDCSSMRFRTSAFFRSKSDIWLEL